MDRIFPTNESENRVICVPGVGSTKPFSVLVTNTECQIIQLTVIEWTILAKRYRFEHGFDNQPDLLDDTSEFQAVLTTLLTPH